MGWSNQPGATVVKVSNGDRVVGKAFGAVIHGLGASIEDLAKNEAAKLCEAVTAKPDKPVRPLKAFMVSEDHDGRADVYWATCGAAARRQAMGELNREFGELSTKRVPELDSFTGDLDEWKFENDWWSDCHFQSCHKERCTKDGGAVYRDGLWCCCAEHVTLELARRAEEANLKEAATAEALLLKPGSTVHDVHFNPDGTALLSMTFPSGTTRWYTLLAWLASEEGQLA